MIFNDTKMLVLVCYLGKQWHYLLPDGEGISILEVGQQILACEVSGLGGKGSHLDGYEGYSFALLL